MPEYECVVDLIRHAESALNVAAQQPDWVPIIGGRQNEIPLSPGGEEQARQFGEYAARENIVPDVIYCSPARRTRQTFELSTRAMGLCVEPIIDDRLQELEKGDWTNQSVGLYHEPANSRLIKEQGKDFAPPNGESVNMAARRMEAFFGSLGVGDEVAAPYIWAYTHGNVIKCWAGNQLGWSYDQTVQEKVDNVSVTRVARKDGIWFPVFVNQRVIE